MLASEVAAYNTAATNLKLIPDSAEYANGQDYSLQHSCTSNMNNDIERTILPKLAQLKKQVKEEIRRNNKQNFQKKCEVEQLQESVNDRKEEVSVKKEALSKIEAEIENLKMLTQKGSKTRSSEKSRLEQRIAELRIQIKEAESSKPQEEFESQTVLKEFEQFQKDCEKDLQILCETRDRVRDTATQSQETLVADLLKLVNFLEEENDKADKWLTELESQEKRNSSWLEEKERQISKLRRT